jgi:hypothetical protein
MVLFKAKKHFVEALQSAGNAELEFLYKQMDLNPELKATLNTRISSSPKYQYLTDDPIFKNARLIQVIEGTIKEPSLLSYFLKNSQGLYVGFIAADMAIENGEKTIDDIKMFSFGLEAETDENLFYKDVPPLLDTLLKDYSKISWRAIEGNKANVAYSIYTKRHHGVIEKAGKIIQYTCYQDSN